MTDQILKASELSGVSFQSHFYWKRKDPDYPALLDAAREIALGLAESEVFRRGITGYEKYLSYKGKKGDQVTEYSDNLAMFFIKGYRQHFRDGVGSAPIGPSVINLTVNTSPASPRLIDTTKALPAPVPEAG